MVDAEEKQILIRTRSLLPEARVNVAHMPSVEVKFPGPVDLVGVLDVPAPDPQTGVGVPAITILGNYDVQEDWIASLLELAEKPLPAGSPFGYFASYPSGLQELAAQAGNEQRAILRKFIELIRWRTADFSWSGMHIRGIREEHEWSQDSVTWHPLDLSMTLTFSIPATGPELTNELEDSLNLLAAEGQREPLGWEVWHNALAARDRGDTRTAVILSVNAVEIELKRLIGQFVPDAEWLIMNLQAPDVFKMVREYLPELPQIKPELLPTKRLRSVLHDAIRLRNDLIHVGQPKGVERDATQSEVANVCNDTLAMVSDLLWLFDAYRGNDWALYHLSARTREELELSV